MLAQFPYYEKLKLLPQKNKALVEEVWQIVNREYIDDTFNHQDWKSVRQQYLNRSYTSSEEAYKAIREMLKLLGDPSTRFIEPQEFKLLQSNSSKDLAGVGVQIQLDQKTQKWQISAPIDNSPASYAGLLPRDVLVKIDGQSTDGMTNYQVFKHLQGQAGTQVVLTIQRDHKELEFKITRQPIELHPVRYSYRKYQQRGIGYIRLNNFSAGVANEMRKSIEDLEKQNVTGYILDLRSNPGGLLYTVIEIARMWINDGTIVSIIDRQGKTDRYKAIHPALTNKPLVIIVNEGTSSGTEILAGAFQDNQRAVLVGTKTNGRNSIQSVHGLSDGCGLAVTVSKWLTPKQRDIDKSGITPDVVVTLTEAKAQALNQEHTSGTLDDPQYAKALESRVNASNFVALDTDKKLKTLSEYLFFIQNRRNYCK